MIYHIRTYKKYGYWPKDLSPYSNKPILVMCNICKQMRTTIKCRSDKSCTSCALIKRWSNPKEQEKQSVAQRKRYEDPKEHEKSSKAGIKVFEDDHTLAQRISESLKNSETHRIAQDKQIGGNDMCRHHYIYDFNDLNKHIIEITRSEHATIHNNLRFANLEVPHINILKED